MLHEEIRKITEVLKKKSNEEVKQFHDQAVHDYVNTKQYKYNVQMIASYNELIHRAEKINKKNPRISSLF